MNRYGHRFSTVDAFIRYCKQLNVKTTERELEYYEKIGAMLPAARVVYPDEYVIERAQAQQAIPFDHEPPVNWPEVTRLTEHQRHFPTDYHDFADDDLIHCFDREIGNNSLLNVPSTNTYRPWNEYYVVVPHPSGRSYQRSTADHYYSYWQTHQLYFLQTFPDLYRNKPLIDRISDEDFKRLFRPRHPRMLRLVDFDGMRRYFDFLSFWITMYERERDKTFALAGGRNAYLNDAQFNSYKERLTELLNQSTSRFTLDCKDLYMFLGKIVDLYESYRRDERYKLLSALKDDVFYLEGTIELCTGDKREAIANNLASQSGFWAAQTFRHLSIAEREREYSHEFIFDIADKCHSKWSRSIIPVGHSQKRTLTNS